MKNLQTLIALIFLEYNLAEIFESDFFLKPANICVKCCRVNPDLIYLFCLNAFSLQLDLCTWDQSNLSKVVQLQPEQKQQDGKPVNTWLKLLKSLGRGIDLFSIGVSAEVGRTNMSQQTTGMRDVNDWPNSNLTWKWSPTLFPRKLNQKLVFASFISGSASC